MPATTGSSRATFWISDHDGDTAEFAPVDRAGRPRVLDDAEVADTGVGTAPIVDMGAFERR